MSTASATHWPTPPARNRGWALLAFTLAVLLAIPCAAAHTGRLTSSPAEGTRLNDPPAFVSVTLTEPADADGSTLQVVDSADRRVDLDDVTMSGGPRPTLRVSLPPDLPDGSYRILWQAISGADGHVTHGQVGFAVGDFVPPGSPSSDPDAVAWLGATGRLFAFLGLALGFGAALFLAWVPGAVPVPRRPVLETLLLGSGLHLLGIVLLLKSTMDHAGLGAAGFATTSIGKMLLLRLGLGVAALAFAGIASMPRVPARLPPPLAVALLVASGLGSARFGHASTAGIAGIVVDAMHLVAVATWVGGLIVFLWLLVEARRTGWTADAVRVAGVRFGTAALISVVVVLAAGLGATLSILGPAAWLEPAATLSSTWGRALAAKVALTFAMLALGAVNRYGILEPAASGGLSGRLQHLVTRWAPNLRVLDGGAPSMRRLLAVEAAFGVATLALAAILTSVSPPADAAIGPTTVEVMGFGADFHGILVLDPTPVVGATSTVRVLLQTHAGIAVEGNDCGRVAPDSCVSATVGTDGGESHALQPLGGGIWEAQGILWTTEGESVVRVTVSTSEVPNDTLDFAFTIAPAE
ncbi:MAG: copper resistance protein CopC [Candidatus Thermoplasmatota archaeon]